MCLPATFIKKLQTGFNAVFLLLLGPQE